MSDGTEIHRLASACTPHAYRGSQGIVSTSHLIFSYILSEDFTQKNFTHNQNVGVSKSAIDQSHSSSLQRLLSSNKAVQRSTDTLTTLIFLNEEELSRKSATASKASVGRLTFSALRAESWYQNKPPGLVITSGPDLLSGECLPVPLHVRAPRIRAGHLMALVACGYADSVTECPFLCIFFSKFHFLFQASVLHLLVSLYNVSHFRKCCLSTKK